MISSGVVGRLGVEWSRVRVGHTKGLTFVVFFFFLIYKAER